MFPFSAFAATPEVLERWPLGALLGLALLSLSAYAAALWVFARRQFIIYIGMVRHLVLRYFRRPPSPPRGPQPEAEVREEAHV